jgi:hypothetical protein
MKDKKLEKLIRQVSNAPLQKTKKERFSDPTLRATERPGPVDPDAEERLQMFKEMKRREF